MYLTGEGFHLADVAFSAHLLRDLFHRHSVPAPFFTTQPVGWTRALFHPKEDAGPLPPLKHRLMKSFVDVVGINSPGEDPNHLKPGEPTT
ncbi:hypothetical protein BPNPMPFG_006460 [Mesorhizobium sp. AR07]|uniref:hypothetical protein n=1 Tax=Mesorhizobium sp. AR07 TaxID=2865838 RepID=UPI00215E2353|nr:hypothetical protein [Mesorhizobium sp. AR07]UVK44534.1 hypothetical protein BPNPMPFG_006460 [Mesorhizobium sp. AR07]